MQGDDLRTQLLALSATLTCLEVLLRVECANLETVYASVDGDVLRVSDRGETFAYLDGSDPGVDVVSLDTARALCAQHGVTVDDGDPELYPRIEVAVEPEEDVQQALDRVAAAIDSVFAAAQRS